jgi:hypothetical protein
MMTASTNERIICGTVGASLRSTLRPDGRRQYHIAGAGTAPAPISRDRALAILRDHKGIWLEARR